MKIIDRLINRIADAVVEKLSSRTSWERFLPPVVLHQNGGEAVYMVTENGSIYRMNRDLDGFETIAQIRRG